MKKLIPGWIHRPGRHCASTAISDVMRFNGHDLSEAMCFGLASGVGFFYLESDFLSPTRLFHPRSASLEPDFFSVMEIPFLWKTDPDSDAAMRIAEEWIDREVPLLIQTDIFYLDYFKSSTHFNGHVVGMWGYDKEKHIAYLSDTEREGLQEVSYESLKRARTSQAPPVSLENNYCEISCRAPLRDLRSAIPEALKRTARTMTAEEGPQDMALGGISAMKKLAERLPSWREAQDWQWCARFGYQIIEKRGTGGGGFRFLYRDFLMEAEALIPELRPLSLSDTMDTIARQWTEISNILKLASENGHHSLFEQAGRMVGEVANREKEFYRLVLSL